MPYTTIAAYAAFPLDDWPNPAHLSSSTRSRPRCKGSVIRDLDPVFSCFLRRANGEGLGSIYGRRLHNVANQPDVLEQNSDVKLSSKVAGRARSIASDIFDMRLSASVMQDRYLAKTV